MKHFYIMFLLFPVLLGGYEDTFAFQLAVKNHNSYKVLNKPETKIHDIPKIVPSNPSLKSPLKVVLSDPEDCIRESDGEIIEEKSNNIPEHTESIIINENGWSKNVGTFDPITKTATLNQDLPNTIIIKGESITLDGAGYTITGNGWGTGIFVSEGSCITVKNIIIKNYHFGILVQPHFTLNSDYGPFQSILIKTNKIINCIQGIGIYGSSGNKIEDNLIDIKYMESGGVGISIGNSKKNELLGNKIIGGKQDYTYGIFMESAAQNLLKNNIMENCIFNFSLLGENDEDFDQDIDASNLVNSKPVLFLSGISDVIIDSLTNAGTIYLINTRNITIMNQKIENNGIGIYLRNAFNTKIEKNSLLYSFHALFIVNSCGLFFSGNTCSYNYEGVRMVNSHNNKIVNNKIEKNVSYGILLYQSHYNNIFSNILFGNRSGATCIASHDNSLVENQILSNLEYGIYIEEHITSAESKSNSVFHNTIEDNFNFGIFVNQNDNHSQGPYIYNNNFINNSIQASVRGICNFYQDLPVGGNYWNDWNTPDVDQNGFVDKPYYFQGGKDLYPWSYKDDWIIENKSGIVSVNMNPGSIPLKYQLYNNYPNPFNPATVIRYDIPFDSHVSLKIYDSIGNEVAALVNNNLSAGTHETLWNAEGMPSGMYLCRLRTPSFEKTAKMLLLK